MAPLQNARNECLISAIDSLMKYKSFAKKSAWKDCDNIAKSFVKSTPQDIGYSAALLFFVHGFENESDSNTSRRGALVPGSVVSFPETEDGFIKVKKRYSPLLVQIQKSWPGFFRAIIVELVNVLLQLNETSTTDVNSIQGISRAIFFFLNWLAYLLSSEWYAAVISAGKSVIDANDEDKKYLTFLRQNIPLLRIRDRCSEVFYLTGGSWSGELLSIVNNICKGQEPMYRFIATKYNCADINGKPANEGDEENTRNEMSLEEMELMLSSSDSECDAKDAAPGLKRNGFKTTTTVSNEFEVKPDVEDESLCKGQYSSAWELCETWEACAIGTLPIR